MSKKIFLTTTLLGSTNFNPLKPKIDFQLATEDQVFRKMVMDYYDYDPRKNVTKFIGQIVKVIKLEEEKKDNYLNILSKALTKLDSAVNQASKLIGLGDYGDTRYKVRALDLDIGISTVEGELNPNVNINSPSSDTTEKEYADCIAANILYSDAIARDGKEYNVGDIVKIEYDNIDTREFGYILEKIADAPEGDESPEDEQSYANGSSVFNTPPSAPTPTGNKNIWSPLSPKDEEYITQEVWERGQKIGMLQLKRAAYNKYLRPEATDAFLKMAAAAKSEGITIQINSGFRTMDQQINLYNGRYTPGYLPGVPVAEARKRNSKKSPKELTTGYPGTSNHQNGLAIDFLNMNSTSQASFQWLFKNAYKFGFDWSEGKRAKEPWHWTYGKK
jgi:LAS superfamily LD-carboxypeptidase LdcB